MTQPEALRLAELMDAMDYGDTRQAAAELRRLREENERFAALVCEYASEEAPPALRTVAADRDRWHTKAEQAEAQRDALLEALKVILNNNECLIGEGLARAAIAKTEEA